MRIAILVAIALVGVVAITPTAEAALRPPDIGGNCGGFHWHGGNLVEGELPGYHYHHCY